MQAGKGLVILLAISALGLACLTGDLWVFHGPLYRELVKFRPGGLRATAAAGPGAVVALVARQPILRPQLDRAVAERLWLEGKMPGDLAAEPLQQVRHAVLDDLIDLELLRATVAANGVEAAVNAGETEAALRRFSARFASTEERDQALAHEGIGNEQELRLRLAAGLARVKFLDARVTRASKVSEEEAREWFSRHAAELALPERVRARHVFLATLERDPAEAKAMLAAALGKLERKEARFPTLAAEISEDERSKSRGGDLGWFSRTRLPADFTAPVFALPTGRPALVRTKLGWHLVEVTERRPAETRTFEDAQTEVVAALESAKRRQAADAFRASLRQAAAADIQIIEEALR